MEHFSNLWDMYILELIRSLRLRLRTSDLWSGFPLPCSSFWLLSIWNRQDSCLPIGSMSSLVFSSNPKIWLWFTSRQSVAILDVFYFLTSFFFACLTPWAVIIWQHTFDMRVRWQLVLSDLAKLAQPGLYPEMLFTRIAYSNLGSNLCLLLWCYWS